MTLTANVREKAGLPKIAVFVCALCVPLQPAFACMPLNKPLGVSICAAGTPWELRDDRGDDFLFYNTSDDFAGSVRIYDGGTDDGLDSERAARLFARSDSIEAVDFALLQSGKVSNGNFVYTTRGSLNGRSSIYVNTVSVGPTKTLRITTWRLGDKMFETDRERHVAFGKLLKAEP